MKPLGAPVQPVIVVIVTFQKMCKYGHMYVDVRSHVHLYTCISVDISFTSQKFTAMHKFLTQIQALSVLC